MTSHSGHWEEKSRKNARRQFYVFVDLMKLKLGTKDQNLSLEEPY